MSLFDNELAKLVQNKASETEERPQAEFWINVGIGEGDEFVSLPYGIPLDTMKPRTGNSEFASNSNAVLEAFIAAAQKLEPGERIDTSAIRVQIQRVGKPKEAADKVRQAIAEFTL